MQYALLELHDVSPYYRREFLKALELLEELEIYKFSLLVVPYFWEIFPLVEDKELLGIIKSLPAEVVLHGYTHKGTKRLQDLLWTDGEGEFGGLDLTNTYYKISSALDLIEYAGLKSDFFVPPAWIGNPYLEDVLYSFNFKGVAYRWHIKDLQGERLIRSPALSFSNRYLFSWLSLKVVPEFERLYKRQRVLRLALHMKDFKDDRKINLWREILQRIKETRRWISYGELFSKGGPSSSFQGFQPAWRMV